MSLERDVADLRLGADVLEHLGVEPVAILLRDIARAAEQAGSTPISTAEQMRWTPVVAHASGYARAVVVAAPQVVERLRPREDEPAQDLDAMIRDLESTLLRSARPLDANRPADGVQ